jgi:hypothetical protein
MSRRTQSRFFDGMQDNWSPLLEYPPHHSGLCNDPPCRTHFDCFWPKKKKLEINEASIRGVEALQWKDQERLRKRLAECLAMQGISFSCLDNFQGKSMRKARPRNRALSTR